MDRTLAAFAASGASLEERLAVAREIARGVAALHERGRLAGALDPSAVRVLDGGAVVLLARGDGAPPRSPLARAGFDAPEVARGARPTRRSDAFAASALAYLALARRAPFEADGALETVRRVLFFDPEPLRVHAPGVSAEVEAEIAAMLDRRPGRRSTAAELVRVIEAMATSAAVTPPHPGSLPRLAPGARGEDGPTATPTATTTLTTAPPHPGPLPRLTPGARAEEGPTATATPRRPLDALLASSAAHVAGRARRWATELVPRIAPAVRRHLPTFRTGLDRVARAGSAAAARVSPLLPESPARRAGLAAVGLAALALAFMPGSDGALEREVAALIERGDHATAKRLLDEAARDRPGDALVEKLRGDVACARGAPGECLRRYRVALAARRDLREDDALRRNVRRLLGRAQSCGARRAAAELLGEIRDPDSLPSLEEARRTAGIFGFLCTGDSIDRAIAATRAGDERAPSHTVAAR